MLSISVSVSLWLDDWSVTFSFGAPVSFLVGRVGTPLGRKLSRGLQGSDWVRLWTRGEPRAQWVGSEGSGRGGRSKVNEMTDLLGVSKSLIRPPFRSSL